MVSTGSRVTDEVKEPTEAPGTILSMQMAFQLLLPFHDNFIETNLNSKETICKSLGIKLVVLSVLLNSIAKVNNLS